MGVRMHLCRLLPFQSGLSSKNSHYENLPMQYTEIFLPVKIEKFHHNFFYIFLIFAQNRDCGYTLEPRRF